MIPLAAFEEIIDASGVAPRIEAMLPAGARARQLSVRTLLAGMCLTQALSALSARCPARTSLTGCPHRNCRRSATPCWKHRSRRSSRTPASLAVDWTDLETLSRPPPHGTRGCAGPEASWGHRRNNLLHSQDELFYGCYFSAGTMDREENGPDAPEFTRRMTVCSCRHDPARVLVPVLTAMPEGGTPLGGILADSGYAHRDATAWALPLRRAGAQLVQDLHPHDRGPRAPATAPSSATGT